MPKIDQDSEDQDFFDGMKRMFGIMPDKSTEIIEKLDADTLLALNDAIANRDKDLARKILDANEDYDLEEPSESKKPDDEYAPLKIGQSVEIAGETRTVRIPNGPGNTVGVMINGKLKMIKRSKIDDSQLTENVVGMSGIPSLFRLRQLAGLPEEIPGDAPPCDVETVEVSAPVCDEPADVKELDPAVTANGALDTLEQVLSDLKLSDIKVIRQRLMKIQATLNECNTSGKKPRI